MAMVIAIGAIAVGCGGGGKSAPTAPTATPTSTVATNEPVAGPMAAPVIVAPAPLPPIPTTPVRAPDGLVATIQVRDPAALIAVAARYVQRIEPGVAAVMSMPVLSAALMGQGIDLSGADLGRGVRALVLDPALVEMPLVVVVAVADRARLERAAAAHGLQVQIAGAYAAVGSHDALVLAAGHALTIVAGTPLPAEPSADVDVGYLVRRYHSQLEAAFAQIATAAAPAQAMTQRQMMGGVLAFLEQLERIGLTLEVDAERASLVTRIRPVAGTTLAAFVARQTPATFALLDRVSAGPLLSAGRLDVDSLWTLMADAMGSLMQDTYGDATPAIQASFRRWAALKTGEHAARFTISGRSLGGAVVWQTAQAAEMRAIWADQLAAMARARTSIFDVTTRTTSYKGTKILIGTMAVNKRAPADQRALYAAMGTSTYSIAALGKGAVFGFGNDGLAESHALIDRSRPGAAPLIDAASARFATVVADACRRGESYLMMMDLPSVMALGAAMAAVVPPTSPPAALTGEPFTFGLGASSGALAIRLTAPATQIAAMTGGAAASGADAAIATMGGLADELCRCADLTCAQGVMTKMAHVDEPAGKPTKAQMERAMKIAERMADCQKALMTKSPPAP